jgi:heme exporter protein D
MGGYGFYVWGSMAVTFLLMALEMWQARQAHRHTLNQLQHLMELDAHDAASAPTHSGSAS